MLIGERFGRRNLDFAGGGVAVIFERGVAQVVGHLLSPNLWAARHFRTIPKAMSVDRRCNVDRAGRASEAATSDQGETAMRRQVEHPPPYRATAPAEAPSGARGHYNV